MLHQQSDGDVGTEQGGTSSTSWCRTPGRSLLAPGALAAQQAGGGCRTRSVPGIWRADAAASAGFIIAHKSGLLQHDRGHPAGSENPNGLVFLAVFARGLVAAARGSPPATPQHPPETPETPAGASPRGGDAAAREKGTCRSPGCSVPALGECSPHGQVALESRGQKRGLRHFKSCWSFLLRCRPRRLHHTPLPGAEARGAGSIRTICCLALSWHARLLQSRAGFCCAPLLPSPS